MSSQIKESEENHSITSNPPPSPLPLQTLHLHHRSHAHPPLLLLLSTLSPTSSRPALEAKVRTSLHRRRLRRLHEILEGRERDGLHGRRRRDEDQRGCISQLPEPGVEGSLRPPSVCRRPSRRAGRGRSSSRTCRGCSSTVQSTFILPCRHLVLCEERSEDDRTENRPRSARGRHVRFFFLGPSPEIPSWNCFINYSSSRALKQPRP